MSKTRDNIVYLLNNQPNGIRIGCARVASPHAMDTRFHHLSRTQQVKQVMELLEIGVDLRELQTELYLVSHRPTKEVWESFIGVPLDLFPSLTENVDTPSRKRARTQDSISTMPPPKPKKK